MKWRGVCKKIVKLSAAVRQEIVGERQRESLEEKGDAVVATNRRRAPPEAETGRRMPGDRERARSRPGRNEVPAVPSERSGAHGVVCGLGCGRRTGRAVSRQPDGACAGRFHGRQILERHHRGEQLQQQDQGSHGCSLHVHSPPCRWASLRSEDSHPGIREADPEACQRTTSEYDEES